MIEPTSLAYVDPGAGSFVLQALVAAAAGLIVAAGTYWRRIKSFFGLAPPPDENDESDADAGE